MSDLNYRDALEAMALAPRTLGDGKGPVVWVEVREDGRVSVSEEPPKDDCDVSCDDPTLVARWEVCPHRPETIWRFVSEALAVASVRWLVADSLHLVTRAEGTEMCCGLRGNERAASVYAASLGVGLINAGSEWAASRAAQRIVPVMAKGPTPAHAIGNLAVALGYRGQFGRGPTWAMIFDRRGL